MGGFEQTPKRNSIYSIKLFQYVIISNAQGRLLVASRLRYKGTPSGSHARTIGKEAGPLGILQQRHSRLFDEHQHIHVRAMRLQKSNLSRMDLLRVLVKSGIRGLQTVGIH